MRIGLLLSALAASTAACAGDDVVDPPAPHTDVALEFDGLQIHEQEIAPLRDYVRSIDGRSGQLTMIGGILDSFLIPLKLAQRAWPEERAAQRELALGLVSAVGNEGYPGLVQKGRAVAGEPEAELKTRNDLPLPLQAWAFDQQKIGQVSPVIETPQGFAVISTYRIIEGRTRDGDTAEVYQVSFYTHGAKAFADWYYAERTSVAGKVTHVNEDYRRALPPWIR